MTPPRQILGNLRLIYSGLSSQNLFLVFFLLLILSLFLVELPRGVLDILLVSNLLLALTILFHSLFVDNVLHIYTFPTILVLSTVFRLALNVSSTKLILLHGEQGTLAAGQVIGAFAGFAVGERFEVGVVIFIIVAIVNFVVIAKGSARVAEVAARFNLDALPGRQLSIDADLRSGQISNEEALRRREDLTRESRFFGAMDGGMKWVQGDAIAGIAICFVNSIGGVLIGLSRGMDFDAAVDSFGRLTIGDGLVTIIPSLLISVAAGVIVTHASGKRQQGTGDELVSQLLSDPRAIIIAASALLLIGLLGPLFGFSSVAFVLVSLVALLFLGGSHFYTRAMLVGAGKGGRLISDYRQDVKELQQDSLPRLDVLCLEVDGELLAGELGVSKLSDGGLISQFGQRLREQIYSERGWILPEIVVRFSSRLHPGAYRALLRGHCARSGKISIDELFLGLSPNLAAVFAVQCQRSVRHPLNGGSAAWISRDPRVIQSLEGLGVELLSVAQFLTLECVGAVFDSLDEVFGLDEVKYLLEPMKAHHPELVGEIFDSGRLSYLEFAEVLRRLVKERVNIRDLKLILEGVAQYAALYPQGNDRNSSDRKDWLFELHSFLRLVLARGILDSVLGPSEKMRVIVLSQEVEDEFRSALTTWEYGRARVPLEPDFEFSFRTNAERMFSPILERGALPILILCPEDIRAAVQEFFGQGMQSAEWIRVLSYQELGSGARTETVGVLRC